MEWSVMNARTRELVCGVFTDAAMARDHLFGDDERIIVHRATTDEDRDYGIGEDWECEHVLEPHDCIHCNPDYRDAYWAKCPVCSAGRNSATWHKPMLTNEWEAWGECLKCGCKHNTAHEWTPNS